VVPHLWSRLGSSILSLIPKLIPLPKNGYDQQAIRVFLVFASSKLTLSEGCKLELQDCSSWRFLGAVGVPLAAPEPAHRPPMGGASQSFALAMFGDPAPA